MSINRIEAIQRQAARFVFKDFARFSSVTFRLCTLSWPTLQGGRYSLKLLMPYKIMNQLVDIPLQQTYSDKQHEQTGSYTKKQVLMRVMLPL